MKIKLYNTLSKKIEEFKPLKSDFVRMYDCGPTVYFYAHIGNMWRYLVSDLLRRTLEYNGYKVEQVMNITDVGHLTEDDLLAADTGEDRMAVAAKREKKTPEEIAEFYTQAFFKDRERLNLLPPHVVPKATEHIQAMIDLIKILEKKGYTYWAGEKYFVYEISKFKNYGKLSGKKLDQLRAGVRLEPIKEKRHPFDFALWIKDPKHLMHWDSPWGVGYPGWHIECSAMSMKYLGPTLDIHSGGEDNIFPHHENEIAQSEAATGKTFVRYWVHIRHNLVDGKKMSKSKGNYYLLQDLIDKGFDPLAFRYLCLTAHYRTNLNFTWESLEGARTALNKLRDRVQEWDKKKKFIGLSVQAQGFNNSFKLALANDLQMPQALATLWRMVNDKVITDGEKYKLLKDWDMVLGLKLTEVKKVKIPVMVKELAEKREELRNQGKWQEADEVRKKMEALGWLIEDTPGGPKVRKA